VKDLSSVFPALDWLTDYDRSDLQGDLSAGLTVGVMLIPQAMAYAMLAGVEPIYGLYAGLVPLIVYALLGTSRHLSVGPVTVDMLIVAAGIGIFTGPETSAIELAVMVAVMTGICEVLMGVFGFGFMVNFLSRPVIAGFMTAAPLIIASNQLGNLLGIESPDTQYVHRHIWSAIQQAAEIHPETCIIGVAGVILLAGLQHWKPKWPAALIWVTMAIAATWGLGLAGDGVEIVGEIPQGLPPFEIPEGLAEFDTERMRQLAPTALTLALVEFMYVMSLGQAFANEHEYDVRPNRELIAIGAANIFGSLFRAVPISGSFSRSAVNERAGAHTALSNVVAAALVGITLLLLTPLFFFLPIPALAAIIIVACLGMVDVPELRYLLETRRIDGAIALLTFGATLGIGIQQGILIGVGASVVVVLWDLSQPHVVELGHVPGTQEFRDVSRHPEAESISDIRITRIDSRFSFANAKTLKEEILEDADEDGVRALIIDTTGVNDLDTTAVQALQQIVDGLAERDVELCVAGAKGPVRDVLERSGLMGKIGEERFYMNAHMAVSDILERWNEPEEYEPVDQEQRREEIDEARQRLARERERADESREEMARERARLEEEIDAHRAEKQSLTEQRDILMSQLEKAREQRDAVEERHRELEEQQEELAEERERLESERERLREERRRLEKERRDAEGATESDDS
jgi:SulP family sulfate permease